MSASRGTGVMVESWGVSRRGHARGENQDAFLNWPEVLLWSVADGVGGGCNGALASQLVVRNLMRTPQPVSLDGHIGNVTRLLQFSSRELWLGSHGDAASTVVALLMHQGAGACLWAGDSRCYLLRAGRLHVCTRDHSARQRKIDRHELTVHEAGRMIPGNVVTNAVGVADSCPVESIRFRLHRGDRFLLCSDGVSDQIAPVTMARHLGKPRARDAALGIVDDLGARAHADDATVVAVFLSGGANAG